MSALGQAEATWRRSPRWVHSRDELPMEHALLNHACAARCNLGAAGVEAPPGLVEHVLLFSKRSNKCKGSPTASIACKEVSTGGGVA